MTRCDLRNTECSCQADTCAAAPARTPVPLIRFTNRDFVALVLVLSVIAGIGLWTAENHYGRRALIEQEQVNG